MEAIIYGLLFGVGLVVAAIVVPWVFAWAWVLITLVCSVFEDNGGKHGR